MKLIIGVLAWFLIIFLGSFTAPTIDEPKHLYMHGFFFGAVSQVIFIYIVELLYS